MSKIFEIYISMQYDARTHRCFAKAPSNWDEMSAEEQQKFIEREAEEYMHNQIEYGITVHESPEACEEALRGEWGDTYSEEIVEEIWP